VKAAAEMHDTRPPSFFWRGVLILLPLLLLAAMGIASLRQDRLLAEAAARQRGEILAEDSARHIAAELSDRLRNTAAATFSPLVIDGNGRLLGVHGSAERAHLIDSTMPQSPSLATLSAHQSALWNAARDAEFRGGQDAASRWKEFIDTSPPQPFKAQSEYDLGLLRAQEGRASAALPLFQAAAQDQQVTTDIGLPLFILAEYQQWRLTGRNADILCSNVVNHPSLISPVILDAVGLPQWREAWNRDETARAFYAHLRPRLTTEQLPRDPVWTFWSNTDWLVSLLPEDNRASFAIAALPQDAIYTIATNIGGAWPDYALATTVIAERQLIGGPPSGHLLAGFSSGPVVVTEYLVHPATLYADARRRSAWFAALIVVSSGVAAIGFVSAWRGFREQARLSELKSNFVSSVSHELRAPIASMRLLAEALERGKISDDAKKKEYFGFLVQESRRLSSLIENILDFSRIEQGRKKYDFEPANVQALVRHSVDIMRPNAAERRVELALSSSNGTTPESFVCDALAVQQALINLIDNAIKHSPPGAKVLIGEDSSSADSLNLWVEDHGPGIPQGEHAKIFERFYRRGSELRRETQGIGIGLTIVKHIAEAHGGRVVVRSAPGQGSRFTIELPWKQNQADES
jgi:signal transduction histidine kinase